MAILRPFCALRPAEDLADKVAALPYDVMSSSEAKEMTENNPYSFLHVSKAEIDFPDGTSPYEDKVYAKAKENLDAFVRDGVLIEETKPCFYILTQVMNGRSQTGIVGCASIDDYRNNIIKKHELTRASKEADRIRHVDTCNANTGPIFLCYRAQKTISDTIDAWKTSHAPLYDFVTEGGVRNILWRIDDDATETALKDAFGQVESLYIADGHHRCESAVTVGMQRRAAHPGYTGEEEFNFFLCVAFPHDELAIMDYNRVISDLNGMTTAEFLEKVGERFTVTKKSAAGAPWKPEKKHTFGMFLDETWYELAAKPGSFDINDPVAALDVSILQNNLIAPILGITDPRKDERIDFIGGIRGLGALEKRVHKDMKIAFSMFPTTLQDLFDIADAQKIMPPKSTWFEPKLLSGLLVHRL